MGSVQEAAKQVRRYAEAGDPMALQIFEQQAAALGRLFTIAANFTDPHAYFLGGGVVETEPHFREWFLGRVREHTLLRQEQEEVATPRAGAGPGHGRRARRRDRRPGRP